MTNRAERTKQCIDEAFIRVLETISFPSISVNDIIEEAKVSRSTFYKYCTGKYDLAEDFFASFKQNARNGILDLLKKKEEKEAFFQAIADRFNRNRVYFSALLKIKDDYIDLESNLSKAIKTAISKHEGFPLFEADYLSNNLFWAWKFGLSLNRYITASDIASIDSKIDLANTFTILTASIPTL